MAKNNNLKAYVRYDGSGRVIPGSLILNRFKPAVGKWKEINSTECCTPLPSNCIQFIVDTTGGVEFSFSFNTTTPINFTINWGDGTTHVDSGAGGFYSESHTYSTLGKKYIVRVCFDNPESVLALDFPGND